MTKRSYIWTWSPIWSIWTDKDIFSEFDTCCIPITHGRYSNSLLRRYCVEFEQWFSIYESPLQTLALPGTSGWRSPIKITAQLTYQISKWSANFTQIVHVYLYKCQAWDLSGQSTSNSPIIYQDNLPRLWWTYSAICMSDKNCRQELGQRILLCVSMHLVPQPTRVSMQLMLKI